MVDARSAKAIIAMYRMDIVFSPYFPILSDTPIATDRLDANQVLRNLSPVWIVKNGKAGDKFAATLAGGA